MKTFVNPTPVVVLKLEHYGSLGIMRSLGRMGIPVYGVDRAKRSPSSISRFCRKRFVWDVEGSSPHRTADFLMDIAHTIGERPILVPTSDELATFIAEYADQLALRYTFPSQSSQLLRSLCSKKEMSFLARQFGIPTAEAIFPETRNDVVESFEKISFPVMLKGINGAALERRSGRKMLIVKDARQLLEAYDMMEDHGSPNLMIQEYIEGGGNADWIFNGYFNEQSECLLAFTGKKIRQNPLYTGMTSLGICEWNQQIVEITTNFMKAIGYQGIVDIDYRYDQRTRSYKVLDLNPRIGATFRLFVATNGMDVARAMYLDLTGQTVVPARARNGRKWIVEDKDLLSSYRYFREGRLGVRDWIASLHAVDEAGYFSADDLLPCLYMWKRHVRRRLAKLAGRDPNLTRKDPTSTTRTPVMSKTPGVYSRKQIHVAL